MKQKEIHKIRREIARLSRCIFYKEYIMNGFLNMIKGIFIGAGAIVPGVSSGVLCVIFGIYEKLLDAVLNFFKDIKHNIKFLFPIALGVGIGVLLFSNILIYFLYEFPVHT